MKVIGFSGNTSSSSSPQPKKRTRIQPTTPDAEVELARASGEVAKLVAGGKEDEEDEEDEDEEDEEDEEAVPLLLGPFWKY